jgi:hypothetical protein
VRTEADNDGWPAHAKILLERHPRASWPGGRSASAAFWLEVHEHLRRDAAGLLAAGNDHRGSPQRLAVVAAPRLNGLIAAMHGHHQIEDFHYFPTFRRTEPRLAAGIDRLERDHASLGRRIDAALAALGELRAAAQPSELPEALTTMQLAAARYVDAAAALCAELTRHLDDEENLVVPLLLESGY